MKIGLKITLIGVTGLLSTIICVIIGFVSLNQMQNMFYELGNVQIRNVNAASQIAQSLQKVTAQNALYFLNQDNPAMIKELTDNIGELGKIINSNLAFLDSNASAEERHFVDDFSAKLKLSGAARAKLAGYVMDGDWASAKIYRLGEYKDLVDASLVVIKEYTEFVGQQSFDFCNITSKEVGSSAFITLSLTAGIALTVLIILLVIIIKGIQKALQQAVEAATQISQGNMNVDLSTTATDETGTLMKAFEKMVENINKQIEAGNEKTKYNHIEVKKLIQNIAMISDVDFEANFNIDPATEHTKDEHQNFSAIASSVQKLRESINRLMHDVLEIANGLADGNITVRANEASHEGTFALIIKRLNLALDNLVKPLQESTQVLAKMATGDLTPRMTSSYKGYWINYTADINNLGDSLTDLITQLQESIHTTASASAEISSTAETLANATKEQATQTQEVAHSMEEMSRTVTDNAHSAVLTADVARQSGKKANDGGKIVEQTVQKMHEIAGLVRGSANNIAKLGESSKKIGEIISVIDDIADQTNLLSLNAAIEAARAGEQGRGFAVVADSVGKLAISTASATKEIADMIKGIQIDTEAAVTAMEKGTSEVQSGIELADNAGKSIQEIVEGINELLGMVNGIAAASEQQSSSSEQIANNVNLISRVTAESTKNVEDVATTSNELARMTETLTSLVSQFTIDSRQTHRLN